MAPGKALSATESNRIWWAIDATLASLETARNTLEEVFALGANAIILHIIRDPQEAWENGVLKRAAHGSHCTPRNV